MNSGIADFFELWNFAYLGDLSKYMYKASAYSNIFLMMFCVTLAVMFIYYKPLDHIKLAKRSTWVVIVILTSLACAYIGGEMAQNQIKEYLFNNHVARTGIVHGDYITFMIVVFFWSAIFSIIWSLIFKNISIKSRRIPF